MTGNINNEVMYAHLKTLVAFLAVTAMVHDAARSEPRTWTSADGRSVEAEYKGVSGSGPKRQVLLGIPGRGTIPFLLSGLSEADRTWVDEQIKTAAPESSATESDLSKEFLGKWAGALVTSDGAEQGRMNLEITEDLITATNPGGQLMGAGTYKIRAGEKLMRIDTNGTAGQYEGKSYEGIVSIEGKTLKWCSANDNPAAKRPTELKTDVQNYHFLMILEKQ